MVRLDSADATSTLDEYIWEIEVSKTRTWVNFWVTNLSNERRGSNGRECSNLEPGQQGATRVSGPNSAHPPALYFDSV
jgi:hypothetical protein